jgi:hypothetical protein
MLSLRFGICGITKEVNAARILEPSVGKSSSPSNEGTGWIALTASFAFLASDCRASIFIQVRRRGPWDPGQTPAWR